MSAFLIVFLGLIIIIYEFYATSHSLSEMQCTDRERSATIHTLQVRGGGGESYGDVIF